ncbi:tetratricopeptide repeat protein [Deinococcus sp. HMF7620]|uniref:Tetratricopeptide repeat protein n=1 Tax=Deinococcus arboris TaxID=2682977 RepID=A0A7C9I295_9DEIO|nr:tetratricopeptide repeat protein [Deinococcus arboris]MVN89295.1 tetratricopeptide repeat protein [Deinococcus arboris]
MTRRLTRPLALTATFFASSALAAGSWVSLSDQTILGPEAAMRAQVAKLSGEACKPAVRDFKTPGLAPTGGLNIDEVIRSLEKMLATLAPGDPARAGLEHSLKMAREQKEKGTKVLPLPVRREKGAITFETALKTAEALVGTPGRQATGSTSSDVAAALAAKSPRAALALLLAGHRTKPKDPMTLVNLAGVLTLSGLPREAIAVLDRAAELGGTLPAPGGVPGQAVALTNRGHAFLGLGRWSEAQAPLKQALALAPDLAEARMNLSKALLCSGDVTGATRELRVALRRTVAPESSDLIVTEDTPNTHGDDLKPREQASTRRAARTLFDLSRGATFDLPQLKLPRDRREAISMHEQYEALERKGEGILNGLHARATAVNLSQVLDPGERRWFELVNGVITTSVFEPEVWPSYQSAYAAHYALHKAFRPLSDERNKTIEAGMKGLPSPHTCADVDRVYDDAYQTYMDALRPYVKAQEQAMARFVSARVKFETALAANLPDPKVRAAKRAAIEASAKSSFYGPVVYAAVLISDVPGLFCSGQKVQEVPLELAELPTLDADPCGGLLSTMKMKSKVPSAALKASGLGLSWSLSCKKIDIELSTSSLLGTDWLGGFAQASLDWNGDATIFTGVKAEFKLPKGVPATGGLGAKEGLYIKFSRDGIQDAGMRVELKGSLGAGPDASTGLWEGKIEQEFGIAAAVAYWRER